MSKRGPGTFVAPQFASFGRQSSQFRRSALFPVVDLHQARESQRQTRSRREQQPDYTADFAAFKGVTLFYITNLWREIREKDRFPNVHLYSVPGEGRVSWNQHDPKFRNGNMAICIKKTPNGNDLAIRAPIEHLNKVPREEWTVEDLVNYCIAPGLQKRRRDGGTGVITFLDEVDNINKGKEFKGFYVAYNSKSRFCDIVQAIQSHCRESDLTVYDTFLYMKCFGVDYTKMKLAVTTADDVLRKNYKEMLLKSLPDAIRAFDGRLIYLDSWEKPDVLKDMLPLWETYAALKNGDEFTHIIHNDYEGIHEKIWDNEGETVFTAISCLDPSKIHYSNHLEKAVILNDVRRLPFSFKSVRDTLDEGFTRWLAIEADDAVNLYSNIGSEKNYSRVSELLVVAGKFTYRRGSYPVAKSYFLQAIDMFEYHQIEEYLLELKADGTSILDDPERPSLFTKSFSHTLLSGLVHARIGLAKSLIKQHFESDALKILKKAERAAKLIFFSPEETTNHEIECQIAFAEYYAHIGKPEDALSAYGVAEITWKIDESKRTRVTKMLYEMGMQYKQKGDYNAALNSLNSAKDRHADWLSEYEKQQDVFLCDIVMAIGDMHNKRKENAKAITVYNQAMTMVHSLIGACNVKVGKLNFLLANCYAKGGNLDLALKSFQRAIDLFKESEGEYNTQVASTYNTQAVVYMMKKDHAKQEEAIRNALRVSRNIIKPPSHKMQHELIANCALSLGLLLRKLERYEEASEFFNECVNIRTRDLGPNHDQTMKAIQEQRANTALIPF